MYANKVWSLTSGQHIHYLEQNSGDFLREGNMDSTWYQEEGIKAAMILK